MSSDKPGIMEKWSLFLRWWLIFALIVTGTVLLYWGGTVDKIHQADFTKISFGIYAIFIGFTVRNGVRSYKVCKAGTNVTQNDVEGLYQSSEIGWFIADSLLTLGMIGTVLGFIFMLSTSFAGLTMINTVALQMALTKMSMGMSTALYTTAVGLVAGLILKLQLFDFANHTDGLARHCECEVPNDQIQSS